MTDIHISGDILRAVVRGELTRDDLTSLILTHLLELCPVCCQELETMRQELETEEIDDPSQAPEDLFVRLQEAAPGLEASLEAERTRAEADLQALLRLPPQRRFARIQRANRRFRSPFLADRLLEECRQSLPANHSRALEFARLTYEVALFAPSPLREEYCALAKAHQGNALRAAGEIQQARECLDLARLTIRNEGVTETIVVAEVDWLEGTLDKDQGRFLRSEGLLIRAHKLFEIAKDSVRAATVRLSLGELYRNAGELNRAIAIVQIAENSPELQSNPRLAWCLIHNRLLYLAEAGRFAEARQGLMDAYHRYQEFQDPWTQLRLLWLESKIDAGLGYLEQAVEGFTATRDGFLKHGHGYDAALASLELALVLLEIGRNEDVRRVAQEISRVFESQDVHREATAALLLFQKAAAAEQVTKTLIWELRDYFERARRDPRQVFRKPS